MGEPRRAWLARHLGEAKAAEFDVPPGPLEWLVELWADAGQCRVEFTMNGGVMMPLDWPHLTAWLDGAGEWDLAPLYRRGILALSAAYANQANASREIEAGAPYDPAKAD